MFLNTNNILHKLPCRHNTN